MKDIKDIATVGEVITHIDETAEMIRISDATFLADPRIPAVIDKMDDAVQSARRKMAGIVTGDVPAVEPGRVVPTDPGEDTVDPSGIVR